MSEMNLYLNGIGTLYEKVKNENASKEEIQEIITAIEELFHVLAEEEGYDPNYKDRMTETFEKQSIERLRVLEEKIKNKNSISSVQEQTKMIVDKIRVFWKAAAFNFVDDVKVTSGGIVEISFGFSLDYGSMFSDKKVTGAQKAKTNKQELLLEGYVLDEKMKHLIDCETNKEKIKNKILERFPSAYIQSWETYMCGNDKQKLRKLQIRIRDIKDI